MINSVSLIFKISALLSICRITSGNVYFALEESKSGNADEIIDPHSFHYNRHTQRLYTESELQLKEDNNNVDHIASRQKYNKVFNDCLNRQFNDIPDESFSRRLINVLLSSANLEENDNFMTGSILIQVSSSELEKLRKFGLGKATIRDVDSFIASIFRAPEKNSIHDILMFMHNLSTYLLVYREIVLITVVVLYIIWLLLTRRWNIIKLFQASVLMIFITSFIITYFQLLKSAEIKSTVKQLQFAELPIHCRPHLMAWWEKIWHMYGSHEDCQKYYEAREENHFLHVTPAIALSHMMSTFVLHPAEILGDAIDKFVHQSTKNFWAPLQTIFVPLMTIAIIVLLVVVLICIAGGSCGWGIGPFTLFSLKGSCRTDKAQSLSSKDERKPIEVILNLKVSPAEQAQQIAIGPAQNNDSNENVFVNIENQDQSESEDTNTGNSENLNSSKIDLISKDLIKNAGTSEKEHEKVLISSGSGDN